MKKNNEKTDKGFVFLYSNLSYRRKLIRTIWMIPVMIICLYLIKCNNTFGEYYLYVAAALIMVFLMQLIHNYRHWKIEEENNDNK